MAFQIQHAILCDNTRKSHFVEVTPGAPRNLLALVRLVETGSCICPHRGGVQ
jgi:hypothetical protein